MNERDPRHDYLRYSHLGIQFAVSIGVFFLGGFWIDERIGTTPLLALLGLVAGFSLGFYSLYAGVFGKRQALGLGDDDVDEAKSSED